MNHVTLIEMAETIEIRRVLVRPENILTPSEAEVLQLADHEDLSCPRCALPLTGEKLIEERVYEDIVLVCLIGCGWREF
jgi:hypothetical protein